MKENQKTFNSKKAFSAGDRVVTRLPSTAWTESKIEEGVIVGQQKNGRWLVRIEKQGWKAITHDYAESNLSLRLL